MLRQSPGRGTFVVRRYAAIGDSLAATVVADKLIDQGYDVIWEAHSSVHCVIRRHPRISQVREPQGHSCNVNLDGAYEKHPARRRLTFSEIFMQEANIQLVVSHIDLGPVTNCRPRLRLEKHEIENARNHFNQYPKPWVFVCPRSDAWSNRTVQPGVWSEIAAKTKGTKFWIGRNPAPHNFIDLHAQHLDNVITWLSAADLLITVDTGPMHIAAALGIPILALAQASSPELHLSDQVDFMAINSPGLKCLNCQQNLCPLPNKQEVPPCQNFDPAVVAHWANMKLDAIYTDNVSAIVPIYQPDVNVLNRCLTALLPQVAEIIVTSQGDSIVPDGVIRHEKIRHVMKPVAKLGYSKNTNFGARHSTGKYLLLLNDDVFLNPDWVQQAMTVMRPDVGCVAGKLWYQDGTLYHGGKHRKPGERGWGHTDLRCRRGQESIREPIETENVNGAAMLIPRKVFYDIGAFDEDYWSYCSDDDTCLKIRRAGYRIVYQPHAEGIHVEGQSMQKIEPHRQTLIRNGIDVFNRKWSWWWDKNLHSVPGNDFSR